MRNLLCGLVVSLWAMPALAQSTWNGLPDRFQFDPGYFRLSPTTELRFNPSGGSSSSIVFEDDLGLAKDAQTFWLDGSWRVWRRHQLQLSFTSLSRENSNSGVVLQRDFTWGAQTYNAGLTAAAATGTDLLGGYYRFAIVRKDRFEIGPVIGIGYIWLDARIQATGTVPVPGGGTVTLTLDETGTTGSITGAVGGYARGWLLPRLVVQGDYLYIKVKPGDSEAEVTDWRAGANYYFVRNVGIGVQYKFYRYGYDRGILSQQLGGQITYKGFQIYASFLF